MTIYKKEAGVWQPVVQPSPKSAGAFSPAKKVFIKDGGVWNQAFAAIQFPPLAFWVTFDEYTTGPQGELRATSTEGSFCPYFEDFFGTINPAGHGQGPSGSSHGSFNSGTYLGTSTWTINFWEQYVVYDSVSRDLIMGSWPLNVMASPPHDGNLIDISLEYDDNPLEIIPDVDLTGKLNMLTLQIDKAQNRLKLYINAVMVADVSATTGELRALGLGNSYGNTKPVYVDSFSGYNSILTQEHIDYLYNNGAGIVDPPPTN